jgi:hypothetical protein
MMKTFKTACNWINLMEAQLCVTLNCAKELIHMEQEEANKSLY